MMPNRKLITASDLKSSDTFITTFMADRSFMYKTFDKLADIFEGCYTTYKPDPSCDLKILKYTDDMENGRWNGDIEFLSKNGRIENGIHRGIAYLRCIRKGIDEKNLPKLYVDFI